MDDYIKRSDMREAMYHEAFEKDSDLQRWDGGCWIRYKLFERTIDAVPAEDVVPVRHGPWTVTPIFIKCSECGETFTLIPQNYCPNCGAKMDEVEE